MLASLTSRILNTQKCFTTEVSFVPICPKFCFSCPFVPTTTVLDKKNAKKTRTKWTETSPIKRVYLQRFVGTGTSNQKLFQKLPNFSRRCDHSVTFSAIMMGSMAEIVT
jgi:hypothetical protein